MVKARWEHLEPAPWRGTITRPLAAIARRSASVAVATVAVGWMAFCAILVIVEYTAWRTTVFAGVGVAYAAPFAFARIRRRFPRAWAVDELFALGVVLVGSLLTGGIYSCSAER